MYKLFNNQIVMSKKIYSKPTIRLVAMRVEHGFTNSLKSMRLNEVDDLHFFQSNTTEVAEYSTLEEGSANWGSFE